MIVDSFKPRDSLTVLRNPKKSSFIKTWALARLITWITLDQSPGKRRPGHPSGRSNQPRFRTQNALIAGHFVICSILDRHSSDAQSLSLFNLFLRSGGFRQMLGGPRSAKSWLSKLKSRDDLRYVREIVLYLCRYKESGRDDMRFTVEHAKVFVAKNHNKTRRSMSTLWEMNKQAAPYIFAFHPFISETLAKAETVDELVDSLGRLAGGDKFQKLIEEAAFVANLLSETKVRNVRLKDFEGIGRRKPRIQSFTKAELDVIDAIDINPLTEKDTEHWRPGVLKKQRFVAPPNNRPPELE
jgi:hypothetical protein